MAARKDTERRSAERREPPKTAPKTAPAPRTASTGNTAKPSAFSGNARADISPDELRKLISEAAYYRAKQRGFAPGHELEDWIQAEAEVIGRLNGPGRGV
jgi:hypothetical protein